MSTVPSWVYRPPSINFFTRDDDIDIGFSAVSYEREIYDLVMSDNCFDSRDIEFIFNGISPEVDPKKNIRVMSENIVNFISLETCDTDIIEFVRLKCMEPLPRKWVSDFDYFIWPKLRDILMRKKLKL